MYCPYSLENFPSIVILQRKTWKNSPSVFHVLLLLFNITENKPKSKPNPKLRLMDQRLMECLRLRVMDLDFAKSQVYVRGKGGKDRLTTLPPFIYGDLKAHLLGVKRISRP
jgi:integrase